MQSQDLKDDKFDLQAKITELVLEFESKHDVRVVDFKVIPMEVMTNFVNPKRIRVLIDF